MCGTTPAHAGLLNGWSDKPVKHRSRHPAKAGKDRCLPCKMDAASDQMFSKPAVAGSCRTVLPTSLNRSLVQAVSVIVPGFLRTAIPFAKLTSESMLLSQFLSIRDENYGKATKDEGHYRRGFDLACPPLGFFNEPKTYLGSTEVNKKTYSTSAHVAIVRFAAFISCIQHVLNIFSLNKILPSRYKSIPSKFISVFRDFHTHHFPILK